jgi:uncharacterized OsmC-like protein
VSRKVTVQGSYGLRQIVAIGAHELIADEPPAAGGTDEGPDPYEYLLAALGACTNMTLSLYASRKGWTLREVQTQLSHSRSYATDCKNCEQPDARVDRIERRIALRGELSEEQRKRLLEIAERCPVHRTLTSKIVIHTGLAEAGSDE